jgi:hypothetical protein
MKKRNKNQSNVQGLKVKTNVKAGLNPQPLPPGRFPGQPIMGL